MTNLFDLTGKKAIFTGGTRGLGKSMAEGLMEAGASVVIFGTSEKVHAVAEEFCAKGLDCKGLKVNLANAEERKAGFEAAVKLLGGLDIILNAAGIQRRHPSPEFPMEDWKAVLEVNLTAPFDLSQRAAREYLKKEVPGGKIINIASMLSFFGGYTVPAYAAAKGGVAQIISAFDGGAGVRSVTEKQINRIFTLCFFCTFNQAVGQIVVVGNAGVLCANGNGIFVSVVVRTDQPNVNGDVL